MANKIMYKDKVVVDFDLLNIKGIENFTPQSGSVYPLSNHIYSLYVDSNTNIVLPTVVEAIYFNRIVIFLHIQSAGGTTPTVNLGTAHSFDTIPTLTAGHYELTYDYFGYPYDWVVDIKKVQ